MTTPSPARLAKLAPALLAYVQKKTGEGCPEAATLEAQAYATPRAVRAVVVLDSDPIDPRENGGSFGRILTLAPRRSIASDETRPHGEEHAEEIMEGAAVRLPIYMFSHSGDTIATKPFGCRWDSGQVGWVYCTPEDLKREGFTVERATEFIQNEIATQDHYIRGNVYGCRILDDDGEEINACWGFYGDDHTASGLLEYAQQYLPGITADKLEEGDK